MKKSRALENAGFLFGGLEQTHPPVRLRIGKGPAIKNLPGFRFETGRKLFYELKVLDAIPFFCAFCIVPVIHRTDKIPCNTANAFKVHRFKGVG